MRARQIAGSYGFSNDEQEDIVQELTLEYLHRIRQYDGRRSSVLTFGRRIVDNRIASMIESKRAQRRDYRLSRSLEGLNYEQVSPSGMPGSESDRLRIDVALVIDRLRPDLAAICRLLLTDGVTHTARKTGISRATAYRRLSELREIFKAAGLGHHGPRSNGSA